MRYRGAAVVVVLAMVGTGCTFMQRLDGRPGDSPPGVNTYVLSRDARYVAFSSNLVELGSTFGSFDVYVRDARTADEDLRALLAESGGDGVAGALLFTCNGRGSRLFDEPDHDAGALAEALGPIPVAGFFAMGEIGPVGGQNFLHGFTASVALFREPQG